MSDLHPFSWQLAAAAFLILGVPVFLAAQPLTAFGDLLYSHPWLVLSIETLISAAGTLLVATTNVRRAAAVGLFLAAAVVVQMAYGVNYDVLLTRTVLSGAILDAAAFMGWLIATRRRPATYTLLAPALVIAAALHWVLYAGGRGDQSPLERGIGVLVALTWTAIGIAVACAPLTTTTSPAAQTTHQDGVGGVVASTETSTLAVAAFISSFFFSLVGIVLGHMALADIRRTGRRGHGLAVAALVIGYGAVLVTVIAIAAFVGWVGFAAHGRY